MWRSLSEADCLAHYQKGDGANPSSAISVIEDLTKKKDAKNADPDPGFHHLVRYGEKRGELHGKPVRAEVVLCRLFDALLGAGLSDLAKQKAGVAQLAARVPCKH